MLYAPVNSMTLLPLSWCLHLPLSGLLLWRVRSLRSASPYVLPPGAFWKVVEAIDTTNQTRVAIKIIRAIPKYRDASKIEVRVLQKLKERDPLNKK